MDVNRHPDSSTLIVEACDSESVRFNRELSAEERAWRLRTYQKQNHDTVSAVLGERLERGVVHLVSIHSFTPLWNGVARPTEVGVLFDQYEQAAHDV